MALRYHFQGEIVLISPCFPSLDDLFSVSLTVNGAFGLRGIYYKKATESGAGVQVASLHSTYQQGMEAIQKLIDESSQMAKNAVKQAVYELEKEVFGTTLNSAIQSAVKTRMLKVLDKHMGKFDATKVGQVAKFVNDCIEYKAYIVQLINNVKKLSSGSLSDMYDGVKANLNLYNFKPVSVKDKTVSTAMAGVNQAKTELDKIIEAIYTGQKIDFGQHAKNIFDAIGDSFAKIWVHCPVNINVYDSAGVLIGYVRDGEIWYNETVAYIELFGDSKVIYTSDKNARIETTGTDVGTLGYSFEEYVSGNAIKRVNYYDIPLYEGKNISVQLPKASSSDALIEVRTEEKIIPADETILADSYEEVSVDITCAINLEDSGTVYGDGHFVRGDSVRLLATANDGYSFAGWQNGDGILVSLSPVYQFTATETADMVALFMQDVDSSEEHYITVTGTYAKLYDVILSYVEQQINVRIIGKGDTQVQDNISAWVASYNASGQMLDVEFLQANKLSDTETVFSGVIPDGVYKVFISDQYLRPIIVAYTSG